MFYLCPPFIFFDVPASVEVMQLANFLLKEKKSEDNFISPQFYQFLKVSESNIEESAHVNLK